MTANNKSNNTVNRSRDKLLKVYVNEEEKNIIDRKMKETGTENFSRYARKVLIDGYIIRKDYSHLKELANELGYLSRSIHQIVKRANITNSIYKEDLENIQDYYKEVERIIRTELINEIRSY